MEMCYDGALVMPSRYAVMDNDEMTYLEGGKFYGLNISKSNCNKLAKGLNVHAAIIGTYATVLTLLSLIPGLNVATGAASIYFSVAGTVLTLSSCWFSSAASKGGCYIGYDSSKRKMVCGYGKY